MTDFLSQLVERLVAARDQSTKVKAEYDADRADLESRYRSELSLVDDEQRAIETLIRIEENRSGRKWAPDSAGVRLPLGEFFLTALHANGPLSKDDLRTQAERASYFVDGDSGGRATHTTLLNLCRAGRIKELPGGMYAFPTLKNGGLKLMKEAAE
ncbi:MAG: hypothetical protein ACREDM_08555 [Methylocella sp.]